MLKKGSGAETNPGHLHTVSSPSYRDREARQSMPRGEGFRWQLRNVSSALPLRHGFQQLPCEECAGWDSGTWNAIFRDEFSRRNLESPLVYGTPQSLERPRRSPPESTCLGEPICLSQSQHFETAAAIRSHIFHSGGSWLLTWETMIYNTSL